jgi:predicted RNA-binding protein YlqC (UPF0109 family)
VIELKEVLTEIVKPLVTSPDQVNVSESVSGRDVILRLSVAPEDMGKVIGRHGRIAKAIRTVMKAAATSAGLHVRVDILDTDEIEGLATSEE